MTRLRRTAQLGMTTTTILIARTISISAGAGARIMDSTSEEHRRQMAAWISAEQGVDRVDNSCGCLPPPPDFDLPPPPLPPSTFGEFGSVAEGIDWATALTSDPMLESCQKDTNRWTTSAGDVVFIPKWPGDESDDGGNGTGDAYDYDLATPRFLSFFDQPLAILVVIAAAACVIFLSICLLALYCRKKSNRENCSECCFARNKRAIAYQHPSGFMSSTNGRRRSNGNAKILTVIEGASPATTTTTVIASRSGYRPGYSLSNACDSADDISEGENDRFLGKTAEYGPTSAAKDWSYNAMRPNDTKSRSNGVNARINSNFNATVKYGAIPTDPRTYDMDAGTRAMPVVVTRSENGKILPRASPPAILRQQHAEHSSLLYDSHNPIYEEISLNEQSTDPIANHGRPPRRLSEGVGNYADSGASSANSDTNFQFADGEDDEDQDDDNEHLDRYYAVDGDVHGHNALVAMSSPCCSSGRSECDECYVQEPPARNHKRDSCPFSPRPRPRQRHQDLVPASSSSVTPSPIRSKLSNKINRSTQSGESCLGHDELYSNCYECSGRESGYGTEGRRHPTPQHRVRNRCTDFKTANRNMQTMNMAENRVGNCGGARVHRVVPPAKFHTMRTDSRRSPAVPRRTLDIGKGSPKDLKVDRTQLQAMSYDNMHLHKSAFV